MMKQQDLPPDSWFLPTPHHPEISESTVNEPGPPVLHWTLKSTLRRGNLLLSPLWAARCKLWNIQRDLYTYDQYKNKNLTIYMYMCVYVCVCATICIYIVAYSHWTCLFAHKMLEAVQMWCGRLSVYNDTCNQTCPNGIAIISCVDIEDWHKITVVTLNNSKCNHILAGHGQATVPCDYYT